MSENEDISRRALLRGRFRGCKDCNKCGCDSASHTEGHRIMRYPTNDAEASPGTRQSIPLLRPPGAIDESTFLRECTRCDACIDACPHDAIIHATSRMREAAGTPIIDPDRQPCLMCEDFPCIAACEPDVLSFAAPVMMGTARVIEQTCIAYGPMTCTVCSEHCPVDGAIELNDGKPSIVEDQCTGCGVCRHVCPAPENAILLMPAYHRPPRANPRDGQDNA